jgi:hypothetical protein
MSRDVWYVGLRICFQTCDSLGLALLPESNNSQQQRLKIITYYGHLVTLVCLASRLATSDASVYPRRLPPRPLVPILRFDR